MNISPIKKSHSKSWFEIVELGTVYADRLIGNPKYTVLQILPSEGNHAIVELCYRSQYNIKD